MISIIAPEALGGDPSRKLPTDTQVRCYPAPIPCDRPGAGAASAPPVHQSGRKPSRHGIRDWPRRTLRRTALRSSVILRRAVLIIVSAAIAITCASCTPSAKSAPASSPVTQEIEGQLNELANDGDTVGQIIGDLMNDFPDAIAAVLAVVAAAFG